MKKLFLFLSLIILSSFTSDVFSDELVSCDSCSSYQKESKARSSPWPSMGTSKLVHILDFDAESITTYQLTRVSNAGGGYGGGMQFIRVTLRDTPSHIQHKFDLLLQHKESLTYKAKNLTIPNTVIGNGWDLVAHQTNQNALLNFVYNNPTLAADWANIFNICSDMVGLDNLDIRINIGVELSDGSKITLEYQFNQVGADGTLEGLYKIDFENSTDGEGNLLIIAEDGSEMSNGDTYSGPNFAGGGTNFNAFSDAANRQGVYVSGAPSGGSGGTVVCYRSQSGIMTCYYKKYN